MNPTSLLVWVVLAASGRPPVLAPDSGLQDQEGRIQRLLATVRDERDDVDAETLREFGRIGTTEALDALQMATGFLRTTEGLRRAYTSFLLFNADEALAVQAVEFLHLQALHASRTEARVEATRALAQFEQKAYPALKSILLESPNADVRAEALEPLLDVLMTRRDASSLRLILDNVRPGVFGLGSSLEEFEGEEVRGVVLAKLSDPLADPFLQLVLLEWLSHDRGGDASTVLAGFLENRSPLLRLAALDAIIQRSEGAAMESELWKLLRDNDPHVSVAAAVALARSATDRERVAERMLSFARRSNPTQRIAAARALPYVEVEAAAPALYELVADDAWRVRAAALDSVGLVRRPESLEVLIQRLEVEDGRLQENVVESLRRLTGLSLGLRPRSWKEWWAAEGRSFVLPIETDVGVGPWDGDDRELKSFATFYGLPVGSRRVAFVLDISGSMAEPADVGESSSDWGGTSRLTVAKRQLIDLLQRTPQGVRFNLVFFAEGVQAWRRRTIELNDRWRRDAVDFVASRVAEGATNLFDALTLAFEDEDVDTIYLLSDGYPNRGAITDPSGIRRQVVLWNRVCSVRIHAVSVGEVSTLLEGLAGDTGGRYVEVGVPARLYNNHAWDVVRDPYRGEAEYLQALDWAKKATAISTREATYANTLGVALYRVAQYREALQVFERAELLGRESEDDYDPLVDWVFRLMCAHQLGDWDLKADLKRRVRQRLDEGVGVERQGFVSELEALVGPL